MFNSVTDALIKKVPNIINMDVERLPQFLTRAYAHIMGLIVKYEAGEKEFNKNELEEDLKQLDNIACTLEVYLVCNPNNENIKSVAYVSAVARKLIGIIQPIDDEEYMSLHYLPVNLSAILLFAISGSFTDAKEIAENINIVHIKDPWIQRIFIATRHLVEGRLESVLHQELEMPSINMTPDEQSEKLIWVEMIKGVKHLCKHLLTGEAYNNEEFQTIKKLSVEDLDLYGHKDIYVGSYLLASFFIEAASVLSAHAVININTPDSLDSDKWHSTLMSVTKRRPYLWDNHIEGIQAGVLNPGVSAVITFPTGSGKTTLSELKVISALQTDKRVLYIVPTHALEYQVENDLAKLVDCVPFTSNRDAEYSSFEEEGVEQILVMTPEHCLSLLKVSPEKFINIGLIVFDEFHLISGNIEDTRAFDSMYLLIQLFSLYKEADYLLMSAMVHNGREIADWVSSSIGKRCVLLDCSWKPTSQLQGCLVFDKNNLDRLQSEIDKNRKDSITKNPGKALSERMVIIPKCLFCLKSVWDTLDESDYYLMDLMLNPVRLAVKNNSSKWIISANYNSVAAEIACKYASLGMKTIIFALNQKDALAICKYSNELIKDDNTGFFIEKQKEVSARLTAELGDWSLSYLSICHSATVHHSLMLPEERILSEKYFKQNGVAIMAATPTLAQGVNLPADMVLIAGSSRFDEKSGNMSQIKAHEILNAAGRAGRAGFRSQGTVIMIPSIPVSIDGDIISGVWGDLKEEIFSKGDRCLEVTDPFEIILQNDDFVLSPYINNRLCGNKDHVANSLGNTFYAYKMRKEGYEIQLKKRIESLSNELSQTTYPDASWVKELSINTGMSENDVKIFYDSLVDEKVKNANELDVLQLFKWFSNVLWTVLKLEVPLLNLRIQQDIKNVFGLKKQDKIKDEHLSRILSSTILYISGYQLLNLEHHLIGDIKKFLPKARIFVLRVIPEISYIAGIFIQVVITKMQQLGVDVNSNELKTFASCIKEGVTSYDMLISKYKNKWMRVECHQKYNI